MLLYNSKYLTVNYLEVQFLFHIKWTDLAKELSEQEIKDELINFTSKMVKRKARHIFCDITNIEHFVNKDFLNYWDKNILEKIASIKIDKKAILLSNILKNSFENYTFDVSENNKIEIQFFGESQKAMKWLLDGAKRKKLSFEDGNSPSCKH